MSRATGIKSPAVLARESRRSDQGRIGRTPATDYNCGPTTTTGGGLDVHKGSFLVLSVKAEPEDDEAGSGEKAKDCVHVSALGFLKQPLNRQAAVVLNGISKASNGREEQDGDVEEAAHGSALHLGGLAAQRARIGVIQHVWHRHVVRGDVGNVCHVRSGDARAAPLRDSRAGYFEFFRYPGRAPRLRVDPCVQVHGSQFSAS